MGKLTFRGGIHPYEGKELSKDHPIEKYLPKGDLVYPLSQHIGAPSVPCVKKKVTQFLQDRRLPMQADLFLYRFMHLFPVPLRVSKKG